MSEEEIGVDIVIENEEGSVEAKSDVLKGDKGDKGDPTATIEINKVITGEAGTESKIENVGTDVKLKLNITIPRGDKGEQGIKGDTPQKGTDYFTEEEIQEIKSNILDQVNQFSVLVVEELPTENIDDHTIYFIPKATAEQNDVYDEYIYVNNAWEIIGNTAVDLTDYYTKTEVNNLLDDVGDTLPIGTIVEYEGDTVPDGYEEVEDEGEVYSTEEVRIGTWIDGKPLYRKTIYSTSQSGTIDVDYNFLRFTNLNISVNEFLFPGNRYTNTIDVILFFINNNNKAFNLELGSAWQTGLNYLMFDIEYTKTTD